MDRIRAVFQKPANEQQYQQVGEDTGDQDDSTLASKMDEAEFSSLVYMVFLLVGIAMLWAWNMFLAAAPYFSSRFHDNPWILDHFQSSITSVSTATNLIAVIVLANLQSKASYPKRIIASLILSLVVFSLLAVSTKYFLDVSTGVYLGFVLVMVFASSIATGLSSNGTFAYASSFEHPAYMQAVMTGQAIAGVLPPIAQIVSVLAIPLPHPPPLQITSTIRAVTTPPSQQSSTSALIYFLTAVFVSAVTLLAFIPLVRKHNRHLESHMIESISSTEEAERAGRKVVPLLTLYKKLYWIAATVFLCFSITMFFPVFTSQVVSIIPPEKAPRILQPPSFIPLAFLVWNTGDLLGRLSTLLPFSLTHRPSLLFLISIGRLGFLPLYLLCNIRGHGAAINSDLFYLGVVQLGFGLTNGWLGSSCMMGATEWVEESEREATGAFMGLNLVGGLTAGSLLSFTASRS